MYSPLRLKVKAANTEQVILPRSWPHLTSACKRSVRSKEYISSPVFSSNELSSNLPRSIPTPSAQDSYHPLINNVRTILNHLAQRHIRRPKHPRTRLPRLLPRRRAPPQPARRPPRRPNLPPPRPRLQPAPSNFNTRVRGRSALERQSPETR